MEYDYARSRGIPVLAFIHAKPDKIEVGRVDPENAELLKNFKERIEASHNRNAWESAHDLSVSVLASIVQTGYITPGSGWVRGDSYSESQNLLRRIDELQQRYDQVEGERRDLAKRLEQELRHECGTLRLG